MKLSIQDCEQILSENAFTFVPKNYCEKYPNWPGRVGVEIEAIPFYNSQTNPPNLCKLSGSDQQFTQTLINLAKQKNWHQVYFDTQDHHNNLKTIGEIVTEQGDKITFEPGGQTEFSSIPYTCLYDLSGRLKLVQRQLRSELAKIDASLLLLGFNPWYSPEEVGLQMTKSRYLAMNDFFNSIGNFGIQMMRNTCSLQINLDFGTSELQMAKRYLAANLIAPFATAIFAYSPIVSNKISPYKTNRAKTWQHLDPSRTGWAELKQIANKLNKDSCVKSYLKFSLDARVCFISNLNYQVPKTPLSFKQWMQEGYNGVFPNADDFLLHLSLLFPEVRPKNYMELRSIDAQALCWQQAPIAFYVGLLYCEKSLEKVLQRY